jgi:hypothetical protein
MRVEPEGTKLLSSTLLLFLVTPAGWQAEKVRPFVAEIKRAREAAGLTLAEVSRRCGIDQSASLSPGERAQ